MHEQIGLPLLDVFEKATGPCLVAFQPFELPHRPSDQRCVEVLENRRHRRRTKPPVIRHPATQDRIVQASDVIQTQLRSISVVQPPRLRPHGFESRCADRRREAHEQSVPLAILHDPRSETISEGSVALISLERGPVVPQGYFRRPMNKTALRRKDYCPRRKPSGLC